MSPLRVLHLVDDVRAPGGIRTYLEAIVPALERRAVEVVVADLAGSERSAPAGADTPLTVSSLSSLDDVRELTRRSGVDVVHGHRVLAPDLRARLERPLVRTVHDHQPYCPSGTKYLKQPGQPCDRRAGLIACSRGHLVDRCGSVRPAKLRRTIVRFRTEGRADAQILIAMSDFVEARLAEADRTGATIERLPLPVVVEALPSPGPRGRSRSIVFAGRLTEPKGAAWAIRAAARSDRGVHLDVLGDGPLAGDLARLAHEQGIDERVTFHGWVAPGAVREAMQRAAAVVVPSRWHEPAGYTALEAFAVATPVIASRVGALPEVVRDGQTGLLVDAGDTSALARAMDRLTDDTSLADRLGSAGRELAASRHRVEDHAAQLERLYRLVAVR